MMFSLRSPQDLDLESLTSTHVCIEDLRDQCELLSWNLAKMRLLLKEPARSILQRQARRFIGRQRASRRRQAQRRLVFWVRQRNEALRTERRHATSSPLERQKQVEHKSVRAAELLQARVRAFHVARHTPVGRVLARSRAYATELKRRDALQKRWAKQPVVSPPADGISSTGSVFYSSP